MRSNDPLNGLPQTDRYLKHFRERRISSKIEYENLSPVSSFPLVFFHPPEVSNSHPAISSFSNTLENNKNDRGIISPLDSFGSYNSQNPSIEALAPEFERPTYDFMNPFSVDQCSEPSTDPSTAAGSEIPQNDSAKSLPGIILPPLLTSCQVAGKHLQNDGTQAFIPTPVDSNLESVCPQNCKVDIIYAIELGCILLLNR